MWNWGPDCNDGKADLYGLGLVLHQILFLETPWSADLITAAGTYVERLVPDENLEYYQREYIIDNYRLYAYGIQTHVCALCSMLFRSS